MGNGRARQPASQTPHPKPLASNAFTAVSCQTSNKKRLRRDAKRAIGTKLGHAPIDGKTTVERSPKRAARFHAKVICLPGGDNQVPWLEHGGRLR